MPYVEVYVDDDFLEEQALDGIASGEYDDAVLERAAEISDNQGHPDVYQRFHELLHPEESSDFKRCTKYPCREV